MKMLKKMSNREKNMLLALACMIILVGYFQFLYIPQKNKITKLKKELSNKEQQYNEVLIKISPKNKVYSDYEVINSKVSITTKRFFPKIIQEKIILMLDQVIRNSGIKVSSIGFSDQGLSKISAGTSSGNNQNSLEEITDSYLKNDKSKKNDKKKRVNIANKEITEKMTINLSINGTYSRVKAFIKEIELINKSIILNNISLNQSKGDILSGMLTLDIYALPQMHINDDEDYLSWNYIDDYGKANPFDMSNFTLDASMTGRTIDEIGRNDYDFNIALSPVTSDLPSVFIGKNEDNDKSYIYEDNKSYINVSFELFKENEKYYYRYKTKYQSYPEEYNKGVEFTPNGESIVLQIDSSQRVGKEDRNGINLNLINKTDKRLVVNVDRDDNYKPRAKIVTIRGDIDINR